MNVRQLKGKTIAFAASGGLDSCTVTRWLKENGVRVIAMTADLGQPEEKDLEAVKKRMLASGAENAVVIDLRQEIAAAGIRLVQARAVYEGGYWNTTGIARHVTVQGLLREMQNQGIGILAHGATGRGNDQVRFSLAANMLSPAVEVYAPWRDPVFIERFGGRREMIDYCRDQGIPVKATHEKPYSTDSNLLGLTHEAGKLEYLDTPANFIEPEMGVFPKDAPDRVERVRVVFERGVPVKIGNREVDPVSALETANRIGGQNGVGIGIHTVENRFVGIKSRGVYESPGMALLSACFEFLLQQILDRRARNLYEMLSRKIAEQVYQGYYFDLSTRMMENALKPVVRLASGEIDIDLYKGNVSFAASRNTPHSLYDPELSSMESCGDFDHEDSEGFLRVLGVSARALHLKGQMDSDV
jgi:argininosuccinate synthase